MKKIFSTLVAVVMCLVAGVTAFGAENVVEKTVDGLFPKQDGKVLFDEEFLKSAGTTSGDWYVISLKVNGIDAEYDKYLDALSVYVSEKYTTANRLHRVKATEWHRISLAVEACGGDAENLGGINLIADGIYNFDLEKQGINAYLWGLIALSSVDGNTPENPINTKESMIDKVLSCQLSDGGFALSSNAGDVDVTAIAITALAPYKADERVQKAIEKAVLFINENKLSDGGFESYGIKNCESSCQALIALSSVGEPVDDIVENILSYKAEGGFSHLPGGEMNFLATQQALLALGATAKDGYLYDFSEEKAEEKTDLSDSDRELIKGFSETVNASDIPTIKRLSQTVADINPDDAFVLKTVLDMALSKGEEIQKRIDNINDKILEISQKGVKISHRKAINELISDYEKLSSADKKLVSDYEALLKLKSEADTLVRKYVIFATVFLLVILSVIYLYLRRKKRKTQE